MLTEFNDGRSKSFYCVAATVMKPEELEAALKEARTKSAALDAKGKAEMLHYILNCVAEKKNYLLKLRK